MDRTKQPSGVGNDSTSNAIEHDGDLFEKSSKAASQIDDESFVNEYAEASQAREFGRSPQPIEHPQSFRPNARSARVQMNEVSTTEHLATENRDQGADNETPPVEAAPSKPDDHGKRTAPAVIPRLMTVGDVATYLGFSVSKVWRLPHRNPDFPKPIKIDGSTRWDPVDIDHFVDVSKARRHNGR